MGSKRMATSPIRQSVGRTCPPPTLNRSLIQKTPTKTASPTAWTTAPKFRTPNRKMKMTTASAICASLKRIQMKTESSTKSTIAQTIRIRCKRT